MTAFKSGYFFRLIRKDYNPFTPDIITIDSEMIHHKRRNWYLLSTNYQKYHFQYIIGLDVRQELFGADIVIETSGNGTIHLKGFSKSSARQIASICGQYISKNTSRNVIDSLNTNLDKLANTKNVQTSVADELLKLKGLLDNGLLTEEEYTKQKQKLLN